MPVNARATTVNYDDTRLDKWNATSFSVTVANQSCYFQLNTPVWGRGENWVPQEGSLLSPGLWTFDPSDWQQYGVTVAQGIRFKSAVSTDPSVITIF